jgi:adenylate kinase
MLLITQLLSFRSGFEQRTIHLLTLYYRNYPESKLQENIDSEIMEVLLQEAHEAFDEEIVIELTSNTSDEMDTNVDRIVAWLDQWKKDNSEE